MEIILYILSGAVVGLAIGMTGIGGGSLMTPILILLGFPYHIAIGTDLLYASITKSAGVVAHHKQKTINWNIALLLGAGSIPAALLTALLLNEVFTGADDYAPLLTTSLGFMLIVTALVLIFKNKLQTRATNTNNQNPSFILRHSTLLTLLMGIFLGVFVTLTSVGAGAIGTAILLLLYPYLRTINIVGTDIAHAVPLTLIAGLAHLFILGNVDFLLLGCLLIGSLPAVQLGTKLSAKLPSNILRSLLAVILMGLGAKFALF